MDERNHERDRMAYALGAINLALCLWNCLAQESRDALRKELAELPVRAASVRQRDAVALISTSYMITESLGPEERKAISDGIDTLVKRLRGEDEQVVIAEWAEEACHA